MDKEKFNIFYAHSSRDIEINNIYLKICEDLKEYVNIYDPDNIHNSIIGKKIFKQIKETDIMIIDITPDFVDGGKIIMNEHVMIELGYGLSLLKDEQIFIIFNTYKYDFLKNKEKIPIFLDGKQLNGYDYNNYDDLKLLIIEYIKTLEEHEMFSCEQWYTFDFEFSNKFKNYISLLLNQNDVKLITRVNKTGRTVIVIIFGNKKNFIEVNNYTINIKSKFKEKDLSQVDFMLNELRHLQILITMETLKYN